MTDKEIQTIKEASELEPVAEDTGITREVAGQLNKFMAEDMKILPHVENFQRPSISRLEVRADRVYPLSEKERADALKQVGTSLEQMVKGDIPQLREGMKKLGLSTTELDEVEKKLEKKIEAAKPVEEAILKGDVKALQKLVAETKPEQLAEITELVQKHFQSMGMSIEVDFTRGNLIISGSKSDRAILISKDKLDVIGVNADGSYDFGRHFRRENPANELKQLGDSALSRFLHPAPVLSEKRPYDVPRPDILLRPEPGYRIGDAGPTLNSR